VFGTFLHHGLSVVSNDFPAGEPAIRIVSWATSFPSDQKAGVEPATSRVGGRSNDVIQIYATGKNQSSNVGTRFPHREQAIRAKRSVILIATTALEMPAGLVTRIYGQVW